MNSWTIKATFVRPTFVRPRLLEACGLHCLFPGAPLCALLRAMLGALTGTMLCVLLFGCGTSSPPATAPVHAPPVSAPPPKASLIDEQRRLAELFRGTPVVFAMQPDGSMRVEVPLRFSFDNGAAAVKPPLAAVLDRVARSQRDEDSHLWVSAPVDGPKNSSLTAERSESTRAYLGAHGISTKRLSIAPAAGKNVKIVVANAPLP